jgi:hypothetical protein
MVTFCTDILTGRYRPIFNHLIPTLSHENAKQDRPAALKVSPSNQRKPAYFRNLLTPLHPSKSGYQAYNLVKTSTRMKA